MRQEYYGMPPPGYYPPPPPYQAKEEVASSGAPWWIWLGAGVLGGQILAKVGVVEAHAQGCKCMHYVLLDQMHKAPGAMVALPWLQSHLWTAVHIPSSLPHVTAVVQRGVHFLGLMYIQQALS